VPAVRKAVITAAGKGTRQYPATAAVQKEMFPLVDRDGITKPTIQVIAEEALAAGIERICIVAAPGGDRQFRQHFRAMTDDERKSFAGRDWALRQSNLLARLGDIISYVEQPTQEGYGHAVYCARDWVGDEPFLLMLGDHVYISREERCCAGQLVEAFEALGHTVSSVQQTRVPQLHLFGTVKGEPLRVWPSRSEGPGGGAVPSGPPQRIHKALAIKEKPTPEYAREHLITEGLPQDTYLCFFGMHVFAPSIFDCLAEHVADDVRERGEIQLTSAQELLRTREPYYAYEVNGSRYDMGVPFGLIETQLALAMTSPFADDVEEALRSLRGCSPPRRGQA